jgi:hypothetical protein
MAGMNAMKMATIGATLVGLIVLVVAFSGVHGAATPEEWPRDFTVVNQTPDEIVSIYTRSLFSEKWTVPSAVNAKKDNNGDVSIPPNGGSVTLSFGPTSNDSECPIGVWVKFRSGETAVLGYVGIDSCRVSQVTLSIGNQNGRHLAYQTDKMETSVRAPTGKYGLIYFNEAWKKQEAATREGEGHRKRLAEGAAPDHSADPEFLEKCATIVMKLRPPSNDGSLEDQFGGTKILYVLSGKYVGGSDVGRSYYKILLALISVDNVHYRITSIDCNLPFGGKKLSLGWGGTDAWWNEIVDIGEQKMSDHTDDYGYSFRCFSSYACGGNPSPELVPF